MAKPKTTYIRHGFYTYKTKKFIPRQATSTRRSDMVYSGASAVLYVVCAPGQDATYCFSLVRAKPFAAGARVAFVEDIHTRTYHTNLDALKMRVALEYGYG